MSERTFYITTPIYYVNDVPHIGHAYTTVACDTISRYKRLCGYDVNFLTGTDEHGQKIEQAAQKRNITPKQLADEVVTRYQSLWEKLNISNTDFIRTTDERHKEGVRKIFRTMRDKGDIYVDHYEGWYCTPCETYLTETQLLEGNACPSCGRETAKLKEPSYFFKMSKYGDALLKHIEANKDFIRPESRRNEIISFIKEGLRDLSVSRVSFKWGIPVPEDEDHVIYVWIDALTNYIAALGYGNADDSNFGKYWPADFHVVGKDILRFHTVYWPTMLMSAELPLPKSVFAHGWWTVEGQKMSKSMGNAIDPNWLVEKFGVDAIRYFLLREVPFGLDGDFSFKGLIHRINGDLANDLGNLLNRTMGMVNRYFDGTVPAYTDRSEYDEALEALISKVFDDVDTHLNNLAFNKALASLWELVSALNKYIDDNAPWALAKDEAKKARLGSVLYTVLDGIRLVSLLLYPFVPDTALKIRKQLNTSLDIEKADENSLKAVRRLESGQKLGEAEQLFPRIDEKEMLESLKPAEKSADVKKAEAAADAIDFAYFSKMVIKAGKVVESERVEKSDKLLKLKVDLGDGDIRQVVSGIAKSYQAEEMLGKTVAVVANLKPAKLMNIQSEAMILAATQADKHVVIELPDSIEAGTIIK
ncbi:methionine--tRNA ligase [Seleniivibrio woodruffii]|uniref:Methionine--tRNA ligase n=1 Tax=Seleniivibrio woodruffii TaxID=1078050 RepID=A0A4R1KD63_9BACT|nr:methionine--tRNA ligase [Seleniivibrio woodruffii]TCK62474.1 methionyl-tRNA synthetase [Seleniivibrio woodruffii]TVZ37099.1 methionyl-tRNA synthetase [Seleniivibrio woodruffii]